MNDTGHATVAELAPDPADFPGADPRALVPGSQVFVPTAGPVPLDDWTRWGAGFPAPTGGTPTDPGRRCTAASCTPSCTWATRTHWRTRHRRGRTFPRRPSGSTQRAAGSMAGHTPGGTSSCPTARSWPTRGTGRFPWENLRPHGLDRTSPVHRFPANGYGLYDVAGNVWEWTRTPWTSDHAVQVDDTPPCYGPGEERLGEEDRRVMKGGSHICAPSYCHRYRPAARQGHAVRSTTSHLGFRCVVR